MRELFFDRLFDGLEIAAAFYAHGHDGDEIPERFAREYFS